MNVFSGSYLKDDVEFLLKPIDIDFIDIKTKEKLIQSGKYHYSQVLSPEYIPTKDYLNVFFSTFELNKRKFANDILTLAYNLNQKKNFVLVSLARAGTPIGVLLKRTLKYKFKKDIKHYSISIIRDREIDEIALKYILNKNPYCEIIFIDGWTGKGVINRELKKFIKLFNKQNKTNISDKLYVVSDIAGVADYCVCYDDYLIPSASLNSTISGLISRSILNEQYIKKDNFHGCKYYKEYEKDDLSLWFINEIMKIILSMDITSKKLYSINNNLQKVTNEFIYKIKKQYNIKNINHIKPGIAESTRVLLRRVPHLIMIKDIKSKDIEHIKILAKEKGVKIIEYKDMPYQSLAIIKEVI